MLTKSDILALLLLFGGMAAALALTGVVVWAVYGVM